MIRRQVRRSALNSLILGMVGLFYLGALTVGMLDAAGPGTIADRLADGDLCILLGLLPVLLAVFFLGRAVLFFCVPRFHPIMRRLDVFGPVEEVADEIDRELEDP